MRGMYQLVVPDSKRQDVRILFNWYKDKKRECTTAIEEYYLFTIIRDTLEEWGCTYEEVNP